MINITRDLCVAGRPTKKGTIYSKKVLNKEIKRLKGDIEQRCFFAVLREASDDGFAHDNSYDGMICLQHVCGVVTKLYIENNIFKADIELVDMPDGNLVQNLYEAWPDCVLAHLNGIGSCKKNRAKNDYTLLCVDITLKKPEFE